MSSFMSALILPFMHQVDAFWIKHLEEYASSYNSEAEVAEERATPPGEILKMWVEQITVECYRCEGKTLCAFPELCTECDNSAKNICLDCSDPKRTCDQCNGNHKIKCQDCRKRRKELSNRKPCQYEKLRDFVSGILFYEELHTGHEGQAFYYCPTCKVNDKKKCECEPFKCACGDELCFECAINKYWESQLKDETEEKKPELKRIRLASLVPDSIDLTADDDDESDAEENSSRRVRARASPAREEGELSS